jgi:hypothetical protein
LANKDEVSFCHVVNGVGGTRDKAAVSGRI